MAGGQTPAVGLSRRMREELARDRGSLVGAPPATRKEAEAIRSLLAGKERRTAEISLDRAMRTIVRAEPIDATAEALAAVAGDSELASGIRREAVALLGEVPARAAARALARLLRAGDPDMEFTIVEALAKVGDAAAEKTLASLPKTDWAPLARARAFARTAILYRLGGKGADQAERAVLPRGAPLPIRRLSPTAAAKKAGTLRGATWGVRVQPELGFSFRCGAEHVLLLDEGLRQGQLVRDLLSRPRLAGLIAMDDRASGTFVTRRLILTRPEGKTVRVSVVRPSGEVALLGQLQPAGKGLALRLRDHGGERLPIEVEGLVTEEDVTLRGRIFAETAAPKRAPEAIALR